MRAVAVALAGGGLDGLWRVKSGSGEAQRLMTEEAQRPFDLEGAAVPALLLRLGEEEHVLLLTMHHIVSDGWSIGVLMRELATLYNAFCAGKPSPLPELADPVCRLCGLAARVAAGRGAGAAGRLLEAAARGSADPAGTAHRPAAAAGADLPGRDGATASFRRS